MCFAWSQAAEARRHVAKLAGQNAAGFYGISDPDGFVWWPPRPGQFRVFYCFYGTKEEVSSDLPLSLDLPEVSKLVPKLASESGFLGIVDSHGVTVQFMLHKAGNRVWMEIPAPEKRGSYGTCISPGDLQAKIESLPSQFSISSFPELSFQSWDASPTKKPWWKFRG